MSTGSESMGETRPGDRIRRGSMRLTRLSLVLWGEFGKEELLSNLEGV